MDFIFMLTRDDQTVEDCLDVFETAREAGVKHMGFKDVGTERSTLAALNEAIKGSNAISYMEIVSTTNDATIDSARFAANIGVDRLLGGREAERILVMLDGTGIGYHPFAGQPRGHPTRLGGTPNEIASDCLVLLRKSGEHLLKQEVFYGARNQVYDGVQARGGAPSAE